MPVKMVCCHTVVISMINLVSNVKTECLRFCFQFTFCWVQLQHLWSWNVFCWNVSIDVDSVFVYVLGNCFQLCCDHDDCRSHFLLIFQHITISCVLCDGILSINITYYGSMFIILASTTCEIAVSCCKYAFINLYSLFEIYYCDTILLILMDWRIY